MQLPELTWMASLLLNSIPLMVCLLMPGRIVLNRNLEKWIESTERAKQHEGEESEFYVVGVTIGNLVDNTNPELE
jgi:hypothetical protein